MRAMSYFPIRRSKLSDGLANEWWRRFQNTELVVGRRIDSRNAASLSIARVCCFSIQTQCHLLMESDRRVIEHFASAVRKIGPCLRQLNVNNVYWRRIEKTTQTKKWHIHRKYYFCTLTDIKSCKCCARQSPTRASTLEWIRAFNMGCWRKHKSRNCRLVNLSKNSRLQLDQRDAQNKALSYYEIIMHHFIESFLTSLKFLLPVKSWNT
jgi:hypothetical protein